MKTSEQNLFSGLYPGKIENFMRSMLAPDATFKMYTTSKIYFQAQQK
jgi:hypothetical protein